MLISRKETHCLPVTPLHLNGTTLETVSTFKYLGVLVSSSLQRSPHIQGVCSKARKIFGLLYRWYYQHSDPSTLLHLYLSLVRPHTEYAAQVWDPHLYKDINSLENIQKFALQVCCKNWNMGYAELLDLCKVPSLENRHLYLKRSHVQNCQQPLLFSPWDRAPKTYCAIFPKTIPASTAFLQNLGICPLLCTRRYQEMELPPYRTNLLTNSALY